MKNKKIKYIIAVGFLMIISFSMFSNNVLAVDFSDIFSNYQSSNSNIDVNYGSLIESASDTNSYRNYLDTDIEANDIIDYDNMVNLSNTVDYSTYLYQQQKYEFNDDSLKLTDGNYSATFNFNNLQDFDLLNSSGTYIRLDDYLLNHIEIVDMYDNINSDYLQLSYEFSNGIRSFGSLEFWIYFTDVSQIFYISLYGSTDRILLKSDSGYLQIRYSGSYHNILSVNDDTWYHIRINFESTSNGYLGLSQYDCNIVINGVSYGNYDYNSNGNDIDTFYIASDTSDYDYHCYLDGLGFSWSETIYNGVYDATYSFDNEIGNDVDDIDFIDYSLIEGSCSIDVISNYNDLYQNHYSVLKIDSSPSDTRCYIRHILDNQINNVNFSIEFWSLQTSDYNILRLYDINGLQATYITLNGGNENQWYHYKIDIDCINGNYSMYRDSILIDDSVSFTTNFVGSINYITFGAVFYDTSTVIYLDALGFYFYNNTGYFNASYDFNDELNLIGNNIEYIDYFQNSDDTSLEVIDGYKGHKNVIEINDNSNSNANMFYHTISENLLSFTFEFWHLSVSAVFNDYLAIYIKDNGNYILSLQIQKSGTNLQYQWYDGSWHTAVSGLNINQWYHHKILIDTTTNNFSWYIDNVLEVYNVSLYQNIIDGIDKIQYNTRTASYGYSEYIDAVGLYYNHTGNFNGTYNFTDDIVGSNPNDFSIIEGINATLDVSSYLDNHINIVNFTDNRNDYGIQMSNIFSNQEYGSLEFWCYKEVSNNLYFWIKSDSTTVIYISISTALLGVSAPLNQWNHIRIDFECGTHGYYGLSSDYYRIYVNGVASLDTVFSNAADYINSFTIFTSSVQYSNLSHYIDALGYTWNNYDLNDNYYDLYSNNTYEVDTNYEYIQNYENTYELDNNINSGTFSKSYVLNDNVLSDYKSNSIYLDLPKLTEIGGGVPTTFPSEHNDGCMLDGKYYMTNYYTKTIYEYTSNMVFLNSYYINKIVFGITCNATNFFILYTTYISDFKIAIYDLNFNYITQYDIDNLQYWNSILLKDGIFYVGGYHKINQYYANNFTLKDSHTTNLYVKGIDYYDGYFYVGNSGNNILYLLDNNMDIVDTISTSYGNLQGHIIDGNKITFYIDTYYKVYEIKSREYLSNQMKFSVYLYDTSNTLKGKSDFGFNYITTNFELTSFYLYNYYYDGSFHKKAEYSDNYLMNYSNIETLEFSIHYVIGFIDNFKYLMINISAIINDTISFVIFNLDIPYFYNFDKMLLYEYYYTQNNDNNYYNEIDGLTGVNTNYFKNDLYGFRTIACIDTDQIFTKFYEFGYFVDEIIVNEIPEVPDTPELPDTFGIIWYVSGFEIQTDSDTIIYTTHFNTTFTPLKLVAVQIPFPVYQNQYSYGAWYDVIWNAIVWLGNMLIIIGAGILYALFTALEYTIVILFFTIIVLIWNFGVGGLVLAWLFILECLFYILPWFIDWLSTTLIPLVLDGIAWFIGFIGGYLLWLLSGGQLDLLAIQNAITVLTDNIFTVFYDVGLIVLRNLVHIINFIAIYLLIYYLMYFKLFLAKSRGFVNAVAQITLVMSIWSYPVKLLGKISKTVSDLVPKILPI